MDSPISNSMSPVCNAGFLLQMFGVQAQTDEFCQIDYFLLGPM